MRVHLPTPPAASGGHAEKPTPIAHFLDQFVQDLRYGARTLARSPGFTLVASGVLALGIGLNVMGFGAVNALLLRPLPFPNPAQLVGLNERAKGSSDGSAVSLANFADWHNRQRVFSGLAAYARTRLTLTGPGDAESVDALAATADFFAVLGIAPAAGRTFLPGDDQPGAPPVVVLSDNLWRRRFQAAPLVGSTLSLDGVSRTVIGIMPPGFGFPAYSSRTQLYYPLTVNRAALNRVHHNVWAVARLHPGRTLKEACAEMEVIGDQLRREYPESNARVEPWVMPLRNLVFDSDVRLGTLLVMAAAGFVLLIGCTNLVNLMLARGSARLREMAVRSALGASRARLSRQLFVESLLLAAGGTVGGLILGRLGLDAITAALPAGEALELGLNIDLTVLGFAALLMLVTTIVVGLMPALRSSRPNLREDLGECGGPTTSSQGVGRMQRTLVVAEIALALVLLVCTGLMTRAFLTLLLTDPGFRAEQAITMTVSPPSASYTSGESLRRFYESLLDAIRQVPGVREAAAGTRLPVQQASWVPAIIPEGSVAQPPTERFPAQAVVVTPGYFHSLGIRLLQGRIFTTTDDRPDGPPSVVVNRSFVERHWPADDPIGRRLKFWNGPQSTSDWFTVVGVVDDVLNWKENGPSMIYLPLEQNPVRTMALIVKGSVDPFPLVPAIRRELARLDSNVPLSEVRSMDAVVNEFLWRPRLFARLFAVSGLLALVLAALGVYGVLAYSVARRTREIGIRATLGATQGCLIRLVLRQGLTSALLGIVIGLGFSLAATRALRSLLFEVSPTDPLSYLVMTGVLLAAALLACYLPARHASRIDPLAALRHE